MSLAATTNVQAMLLKIKQHLLTCQYSALWYKQDKGNQFSSDLELGT